MSDLRLHPSDCSLCPRLVEFRKRNRINNPAWHNGPVPGFGRHDARLLIVGLAPGLRGANRTGRPFTGDHAGVLLYATLLKYGFAFGEYGAHSGDGLRLIDTRITNAVRCVPPHNKPVASEINACRSFLGNEINALPNLEAIVALGRTAHENILSHFSLPRSRFPFRHADSHPLSPRLRLFDSYHCSRYNVNTGRLTEAMFSMVFLEVRTFLASRPARTVCF